ncbi:MAG TPA: DUF4242 domain-containing protein [Candidatus Didemnitutus sp.]|nr:DUF4242 domain-containing protein [Candidatus Didemnitutus sp.]
MNTYVIFRRSGWNSLQELEKAAARSTQVGQQEMPDRVRWIRSYVTKEPGGRIGTVCIYEAVDFNAIREHARRADLPCDDVVPVSNVVIVNADSPVAV